jgi:hypothetical protein
VFLGPVTGRAFVISHDHLSASVSVIGTPGAGEIVELQASKAPYRSWTAIQTVGEPAGWSGRITLPVCGFDESEPACGELDRNFKLRAALGPSHTQAILIRVYPRLTLDVTREDVNRSPYVFLSMAALVHPMKHYPTGPAYFYTSPSRTGPYTLVAIRRFHYGGPAFVGLGTATTEALLQANAQVYNTTAFFPFSCVRHQLVKDMGKPFDYRNCGRPSIAPIR